MLLPFGTLAPGLLLSLLAFAYMLFFGSCALNRTAEKTNAGNHEVRISEAPDINGATGSATYYLFSDDGPADQGLDSEKNNPVIRQEICRIINIPDIQYIQYCHLSSHFTRPPPSPVQA